VAQRALRGPRRRFHHPFAVGVVLTVLNPTTAVSWSSLGTLLLTFLVASRGLSEAALTSLGVAVGSSLWFLLVTESVHRGRQFLGQKLYRKIFRSLGLLMIGFGVYFVLRVAHEVIARY
jgi:threonine/homoserine/homoserine lactone efflux protein